MDTTYTVVTLRERPDLIDAIDQLHQVGWVPYMREDPIAAKYWRQLLDSFPQFQYVLVDEASTTIACGNAIPFHWDGSEGELPSGWDGVFEQGIIDFKRKAQLNTLSALAIVIHPEYRGRGLSTVMVKEMKRLAVEGNMTKMVAPVRPSLKHTYPLIPMEEYIRWVGDDGLPFDPWIRTHVKTGASILKVAERSMVIPASVEKWEEWTGMKLPSSGSYIMEDGLVPLEVDKEANTGVYIEPNVWMRHTI